MSDVLPSAVEIIVNGEPCALPARGTLESVIETLGLGERRIAVAVNREVVPRSEFSRHTLGAGDRVEILQAVGGGR